MAHTRSIGYWALPLLFLLCSFGPGKKGEPKNLTKAQYNNLVGQQEMVLVDFYSPGCVFCKQLSPNVDKIEEIYKGKVKVIRINVQENRLLSEMLNIKSIPALYLYKQQKPVWNAVGTMDKYALMLSINRFLSSEDLPY
ncbi:MAG: conjugal transfer protein TraF [Flavipsychrobacter sp.]|nr:conjugal transfer protein TraF [Flavipsychrobacter sp.]